MVKNTKKYAFNISLQAFDLDYTVNEYINFEPFQADDIDELFAILQPIWLENNEKFLEKYSDNSDVSLTLHYIALKSSEILMAILILMIQVFLSLPKLLIN